MSSDTLTPSLPSTLDVRPSLYRRAAMMVTGSIAISAATILFTNNFINQEMVGLSVNQLQLAAMTLMPYMISAGIAAITAVGVMAMLPAARTAEPTFKIATRLREIGTGNLANSIRLKSGQPMGEIAAEVNAASAALGGRLAAWKVINRQQRGILCKVRLAAELGDTEKVLEHVIEMERNWDKVAEIEEQIRV